MVLDLLNDNNPAFDILLLGQILSQHHQALEYRNPRMHCSVC